MIDKLCLVMGNSQSTDWLPVFNVNELEIAIT